MRNIRQTGFTIVELLIVIVVIAILAAISIVAYNGISTQAATTVLKSDLANAARQLELNKVEPGQYPGTDGATTDGSPLKRSDGTTFQYTRTGNGYCLTATSNRSGVPAFMISSDNTVPQEGTCPGHTGPVTGSESGTEIANNSPIQNVTQAQCQALPIFNGSNNNAVRTVTDNRGGTTRTYEIAKLADNNCWMLDNLNLGSRTQAIILTPSDTNITADFTLPQIAMTYHGDSTNPVPAVYDPIIGDLSSSATYGYVHYNWIAATAGESRYTMTAPNSVAPHSICPANWSLPTAGPGSDFTHLHMAFGGTDTGSSSGNPALPPISNWLNTGPFRATYSGSSYGEDANHGLGSQAWWWSSASDSGHVTARIFFTSVGGTAQTHIAGHLDGLAVRCLLR